jgi:hypothetical protein
MLNQLIKMLPLIALSSMAMTHVMADKEYFPEDPGMTIILQDKEYFPDEPSAINP